MARTLPNSRLNRRALDADQAYNRAVNRGEDNDTLQAADVASENADQKWGGERQTKDTAGQG